ncbi:hypothetical protein HNY73_000565 [Argiope bruennichi]|uniref:Uncharacterized protein n=1 Tax=Argiope bruennichi TaxID=94029 RepID=A0A8T0FYQ0_ARGBR|nr:hypothetical protein HNY73_000565 [Argiope bruennichi]
MTTETPSWISPARGMGRWGVGTNVTQAAGQEAADMNASIASVIFVSKALKVNKLPRHQASTNSSSLASRGIGELLSEQCGRVLSDKLAPVQDGQIAWIDGK